MLNNTIFSTSFLFKKHHCHGYRQVDNTNGIEINYLALMLCGEGRLTLDGREVKILPGDVFYIPEGCRYTSHWRGTPDYEFVSLGFRFMATDGNQYEAQVIDAAEEAKLITDIYEMGAPCPTSIALLYTVIARLLPKMKQASAGRGAELVAKGERMIALHPEFKIPDIARECAVSESALYAAFKNHSPKSMNELKKEVLIKRSAELLSTTDLSVEEISQRLYFSSGAYFRKCFKEYFGYSPREMRKRGGI